MVFYDCASLAMFIPDCCLLPHQMCLSPFSNFSRTFYMISNTYVFAFTLYFLSTCRFIGDTTQTTLWCYCSTLLRAHVVESNMADDSQHRLVLCIFEAEEIPTTDRALAHISYNLRSSLSQWFLDSNNPPPDKALTELSTRT